MMYSTRAACLLLAATLVSGCEIPLPGTDGVVLENSLNRTQVNQILIHSENENRIRYALRQMERLAASGDAQAMVQLGFRYLEGDKVEQDRVRAAQLFERSLETRDNPGIRLLLANLYVNTLAEPVDVPRGIMLLEELNAQGDERARLPLATQYFLPYYNEGDTSRIPEAAALYAELAAEGDMNSQFRLASLLADGNTPIYDLRRGLDLYRDLAERGDNRAQYALGEIYWKGEVVPRDDALAFRYFERAAAQGNPNAKVYVALGMLNGRGTARDRSRGLALLEEGSREFSPFAAYTLSLRDEARYLAALRDNLSLQGLVIGEGRAALLDAQGTWCARQALEVDCDGDPLGTQTVIAVSRSFAS